LSGPMLSMNTDTVIVMGRVQARSTDSTSLINLSAETRPLETVLRQVERDALLFFFVFYNNRAVALSNIYLNSIYTGYTSDPQYEAFFLRGVRYEAVYPTPGLTVNRGFRYLKGEIN